MDKDVSISQLPRAMRVLAASGGFKGAAQGKFNIKKLLFYSYLE